MATGQSALVPSLLQCVCRNELTACKNLHFAQRDLDLDRAGAHPIGHAVTVVVVLNHAVTTDGALERHDSVERQLR